MATAPNLGPTEPFKTIATQWRCEWRRLPLCRPYGARQRGKRVSANLDCLINANRQRQATVAGLQAGQELLSGTLFPVGQQTPDHVLFEKLKNGNPLCLYTWPRRLAGQLCRL